MKFKETFLKLTEYTIPFGHEYKLEHLLPSGWKKDTVGNYYYEIGKSETLFTSHLDVATDKYEKVNHIISGNIIKTDGTTILGGDNKAGCLILFYLIEKYVPGTYYFFLGEEASVHKNYPYGSLLSIEANIDFFKKFKRVISFDRKETGQMVTRQIGQNCCSEEFSKSLINEFSKFGIDYKTDKTGYYTDGAFFVNIIPEIVNLSAGVYNEHTKNEYVDIKYVKDVAIAASKVDWESLPYKREISHVDSDPRFDSVDIELNNDQSIFKQVFEILDDLYFVSKEIRSYQNYLYHFKSGRKYHFVKWHEDEELIISVDNGIIYCNDKSFSSIDEFKSSLGIEDMSVANFVDMMIKEFNLNGDKLSDARFNYLFKLKGGRISSLKSFRRYLKYKGFNINKIGKGYEILKESVFIKNFNIFRK